MQPSVRDELIAIINQAAETGDLTHESPKNLTRWISEDAYSKWHQRIEELLRQGEFKYLNDHFWETLEFGTGGRRGPMGEFGPATINERTIAESAHGLARYMQSVTGKTGGRGVITSDTRNHSKEFSRITAEVFAGNGLEVFIFDSPRSTPALSFAVRHLKCDVGVMISASHNPPEDNGFKAYWNNGAQILSPHDKGIVDAVADALEIPTVDFEEGLANGKITVIGEEVDRVFMDAVLANGLSSYRDIEAIYSPLHGVGETSCYRAMKEAGFDGVSIYEPQRAPDGDFPNVPDRFPNPERTQVYDPIIASIKKENLSTELILASDPDADRIGVCVRDSNDEFVPLTGNQVGALLTDYVLRQRTANATLTPDSFVVETLVTSPMISVIAESFGVNAVTQLLVGFKYIAQAIEDRGPDNFVFGCEESIGYLAGQYCRDKDASIASLFIVELAAELKEQGKSLLDHLNELYIQHGVFAESQVSRYCKGADGRAQIGKIMDRLRSDPPTTLGGVTFDTVRDYGQLEIRNLPANSVESKIEQPHGNLLFFDSGDGPLTLSFAARPSGTEPKIKFYSFARAQDVTEESLLERRSAANNLLSDFETALAAWIDSVLDE
jgi:phosphoglucomutase